MVTQSYSTEFSASVIGNPGAMSKLDDSTRSTCLVSVSIHSEPLYAVMIDLFWSLSVICTVEFTLLTVNSYTTVSRFLKVSCLTWVNCALDEGAKRLARNEPNSPADVDPPN